jgi:hypothetical protein
MWVRITDGYLSFSLKERCWIDTGRWHAYQQSRTGAFSVPEPPKEWSNPFWFLNDYHLFNA